MAMVTCAECKTEISSEAKSCPKCGYREKKTKWWLWIPLGLFAAFMTVGMIISNTPEGKAIAHDRDVIDLCWSDAKKPSLDPATQRFVAGACEKLEADFVTKHGRRP